MASLVSYGAAASSSSTSSSYLARPLSAARPFCCLRHLHSGLSLHRQGLASRQGSSSLDYAKHGAPFERGALFSVKAMDVSGPGSIESTLMISMTQKLKEQLNTNDVVVRDAHGDGRHVSIEVVSSEFEGKSSVNRQRMVYKAIWEELQTTVHAVDNMRTWTPEEVAQERSSS